MGIKHRPVAQPILLKVFIKVLLSADEISKEITIVLWEAMPDGTEVMTHPITKSRKEFPANKVTTLPRIVSGVVIM